MTKHLRDTGAPLTLGEDDFQKVASLAHEGFGLYLDASKMNMVFRRLSPRIRKLGLSDFSAYTARLQEDETERLNLLSLLTTNLTHFYREKHHFDIMRKTAFPHLVERLGNGGKARLWSCACSSGEEPYSIAMDVSEHIPNAATANIKILATDIDPEILKRAETGQYSQRNVGGIPAHLRSKYFSETNDDDLPFAVKPQLKKLIGFGQLNLPGEWPFQGTFDVIFCRNVAIYFTPETQEKLWARLIDRLPSGGLLFIGHSERISPAVSGNLRLLGRTAYQKI
jgi:chemotaxis protein methyltransferase CheR